jgi:hypothetical protein
MPEPELRDASALSSEPEGGAPAEPDDGSVA